MISDIRRAGFPFKFHVKLQHAVALAAVSAIVFGSPFMKNISIIHPI